MDNKIFYKTTTDFNRYCAVLRKLMAKIIRILTVQINTLLAYGMYKWKKGTESFIESSVTTGHFEHQVIDKPSSVHRGYHAFLADVGMLHKKYQHSVAMIKKVGVRAAAKFNPVAEDEYGYSNISNMPLSIDRAPLEINPTKPNTAGDTMDTKDTTGKSGSKWWYACRCDGE